MDCTVCIDRANEQVMPELLDALQRQNLRVITTFDFQLARALQVECNCPHHGLEECNCQYAVLLVYGPEYDHALYRTITMYGRENQVWLNLLQRQEPSAGDARLQAALEDKLLELLQGLKLVTEVQRQEMGQGGPL